jgi:hypothetical protein
MDASRFHSGAGKGLVVCGAWQGVQISPLRFQRYPLKSWGDPTIVPARAMDAERAIMLIVINRTVMVHR